MKQAFNSNSRARNSSWAEWFVRSFYAATTQTLQRPPLTHSPNSMTIISQPQCVAQPHSALKGTTVNQGLHSQSRVPQSLRSEQHFPTLQPHHNAVSRAQSAPLCRLTASWIDGELD